MTKQLPRSISPLCGGFLVLCPRAMLLTSLLFIKAGAADARANSPLSGALCMTTQDMALPAFDLGAELEAIRHKLKEGDKAEWQVALEQLDAVEAQAPGNAEAQCLRGYAHVQLEQPQKALNALVEASYLRPDDFTLFYHLAKQHARLGHDRASLGALRRCNQLAPKNAEIKRLLAALCFAIGAKTEAKAWRHTAVLEKTFFAASSSTDQTQLRVLVLQSAYSVDWGISRKDFAVQLGEGHNNLPGLLDAAHIQRITLYVDELDNHPETLRKLPDVDLVYNNITDAERCEHALGLAARICQRLNKPVINSPQAVLGASREGNYARFKDHPEIILPRSVKLEGVTGNCRDAIREAMHAHDLALPLIVRVAGYQNGRLMHKVEDVETHDFSNIDELLAEGPETLYCIRYHDYGLNHPRAPGEKLYPKYRAFCVDGKLYPTHVRIGCGEWNVHIPEHRSAVKRFPWLAGEWDQAFFESPADALPEGQWRALENALSDVGLDYFGVDFAVLTEPENAGKLVVFETNAAMRNFMSQLPPDTPEYAMAYRAIYSANNMFAERAGVEPWAFELHPGEHDSDYYPPKEQSFDWQFTDRLIALDNAARLPRGERFHERMATNAFAVVAFDPASRVAPENVAEVEEFQHVPHALLGDGMPTTLYATLDETLTATLDPLPAERLPENRRSGAQVLAQLPVNTLRLDDIDGLARLDWLILDELSDALAVLENGERALADTLLLQVGIAFSPTHAGQHGLDAVCHWASRHGFAFYRLNEPDYHSYLPECDDVRTQATQLTKADALFIPNAARMAALDDNARKRLAFLLDTIFGIHDLPYRLLADCDVTLAEDYLKARGYMLDSTAKPDVKGHEDESIKTDSLLAG